MSILKPFFYFYGAKYRSGARYDAPRYKTLIEPFAGAAGYAVRHHELDVRLYDVDPVICGIWEYLIQVSSAEVRRLPLEFAHVDDIDVPQEARWLLGFWINQGVVSPRKTPSLWARNKERIGNTKFRQGWGEAARERIAVQVEAIRHWRIEQITYEKLEIGRKATWFIDPPYSTTAGRLYVYSDVDYEHLGMWCKQLQGQVIVCEQEGADWLPFRHHAALKANSGRTSHEVVWTSETES